MKLLPLLQKFLPPRNEMAQPIHLLIAAERRAATICIEFASRSNTLAISPELLESAGLSLRIFFGNNINVSAKPAPFGRQSILIEVPYVVA